MMRGLQKDLEICNKATPGPWECWLSAVQSGWMVRVGRGEYCDSINTAYYPENKIRTEGYGCDNTFIADLNDDEYHTYSSLQEQIANAKFIAAAREGWPHAIERAIKAEAELAKYKRALELACGALSAEIDKQYCPADVIDFDLGCDYCDNCHDQDESVCWADFYIMQAQKEEDRSADCDI